jgi:uncharacterized membrane protein YhaH (DUF805 family)
LSAAKNVLRFFWSREGRLGRRGFWRGVLACNALAALVAVLGDDLVPDGFFGDVALASGLLVSYAPLVPISIRRLHDHDKSPAWLLTALIPVVGPLWRLLELGFLPGTPGENRYGPPPAC